jgi:ABC-type glutathione transport system ATPase component
MTVELLGVTKRYAAIEDLDLKFEDGQAAALVGESGSGKSTLARLIAQLEKPDRGEIRFYGLGPSKFKGAVRRGIRAELQLVLQNAPAAFDPRVSVGRSIAEPLRNLTRLTRGEIGGRVAEVCGQVSLAPELLTRLPHELSGGQMKRACFARALVTKPSFVVFDEATSGLDPVLRDRVLDLILKLKRETLRSFLFITHDMDAALRVADRILVMRGGAIIEDADVRGGANFTNEYAKTLLEATL